MYNKIGIIGLGLIGGSIAKAYRARCGVKKIVAFNRHDDVLKQAKSEGVIDEYSTEINDMFKGCEVIFICTPVDKICEYAKKLIPFIDKNCILTDVGSTKSKIYDELSQLQDNFMFIGGHPMTGSEKFRYSAAKEHLFENAYYILTPAENVKKDILDKFEQSIKNTGAITIVISPKKHDHIVAAVSHVPHIVASSLVHMVKDLDTENQYMHTLAAGGFKDITRIASSNADMWKAICTENKQEIISVLEYLENIIHGFKNQLQENHENEIYEYFDDARQYRDTFSGGSGSKLMRLYDINVDMQDKPGGIAVVAVVLSSNKINIKNINIVNSREQDAGALTISFQSDEQRQKAAELLRGMNYEVFVK